MRSSLGSEVLSRYAATPGRRRPSTTDVSAGHQGWGGGDGFEPLTSSVRVRTGSPLCGSAFVQVPADRQGEVRRSPT